MGVNVCCGRCSDRFTFFNCGKPAKIERDGKWYCGIHDPEKRRLKIQAQDAKWQAEREAASKAIAKKARLSFAERAVIEEAKEWALDPTNESVTWVALSKAVEALEEAERD